MLFGSRRTASRSAWTKSARWRRREPINAFERRGLTSRAGRVFVLTLYALCSTRQLCRTGAWHASGVIGDRRAVGKPTDVCNTKLVARHYCSSVLFMIKVSALRSPMRAIIAQPYRRGLCKRAVSDGCEDSFFELGLNSAPTARSMATALGQSARVHKSSMDAWH